ncbi:MAG TPA: proline dehydrogenase family protein [Candidatus Krumholzibacteria bacterium]|nr:proline dehydrogenase family protein [Candidatus Krumholzibacteria bacterium]
MGVFDRVVSMTLPLVPKPVVRRVASPYIAGEKMDDLVRIAEGLNRDGYRVAAAILGEFVTRREESEQAVHEYQALLASMGERRIDGYIHVKPTHLGLKLDVAFCLENVRTLLVAARAQGLFVRLDMEDSPCIDDTLEIYDRLRPDFDNVGVVIQSRMRRSLADVRALAKVKANVRVCKGIYIEPFALAYTDPELISRNYALLVEELLGAGCTVAIATHDERLVWEAARTIDRLQIPRERYEFQMLLGVLAPLRATIKAAGHPVRVAVPYGPNWYPYSLRRLRKNPAIAGYVLKSLLKR